MLDEAAVKEATDLMDQLGSISEGSASMNQIDSLRRRLGNLPKTHPLVIQLQKFRDTPIYVNGVLNPLADGLLEPSDPSPVSAVRASDTTTSSFVESDRCAGCNKSAKKCCSKCVESPDGLGVQSTATFYCDKECQKAHWSEHKTFCLGARQRKAVYRAAHISLRLCYIYLKAAFSWGTIQKLDKKGNHWFVHMDPESDGMCNFSTAVIPEVFDQEAILAYRSCNAVVAVFGPVLRSTLKGMLLEHLYHS